MADPIDLVGFSKDGKIYCLAHRPKGESRVVTNTTHNRITHRGGRCEVCCEPLIEPPAMVILTGGLSPFTR